MRSSLHDPPMPMTRIRFLISCAPQLEGGAVGAFSKGHSEKLVIFQLKS